MNKSATLPVQAHPRVASGEHAHIKARRVSKCHGRSLRFEDPAERDPAAGAEQRGKPRGELDQWVRENIGDEHIYRFVRVIRSCNTDVIKDVVAPGVVERWP